MSNLCVTRWIRGYDSNRGELLCEHRLPESWSLERLQCLFGVADDNPMYDCFRVDREMATVLESSIGEPLVGEDLELFLEADAEVL